MGLEKQTKLVIDRIGSTPLGQAVIEIAGATPLTKKRRTHFYKMDRAAMYESVLGTKRTCRAL
jgi:hypothetical protein